MTSTPALSNTAAPSLFTDTEPTTPTDGGAAGEAQLPYAEEMDDANEVLKEEVSLSYLLGRRGGCRSGFGGEEEEGREGRKGRDAISLSFTLRSLSSLFVFERSLTFVCFVVAHRWFRCGPSLSAKKADFPDSSSCWSSPQSTQRSARRPSLVPFPSLPPLPPAHPLFLISFWPE